jgi:hypothetical protein
MQGQRIADAVGHFPGGFDPPSLNFDPEAIALIDDLLVQLDHSRNARIFAHG